MKILLTGSSGFIGQALTPRLANLGELHHLTSDLLDYTAVQQEVARLAPDMIIHLAARTEVEKSFYEQTSFSEVNYVGTVNLIESAVKLPTKPYFVFASTMEVYGWQPISDLIKSNSYHDKIPAFDETTTPYPNAPYAVAKLACEKYIEYAHRAHNLEYAIIRQTNAYGRKDNNFFVTEQIISQMLLNPNVCNLGYAEPYRNFIYVDDLLDAWESVIANRDKCKNNTFTIGPDYPVTIAEHAKNIAKLLGWSGTINWNTKPKRHGEIYLLNSNSNKLTELTGWSPKISYTEGLIKTIAVWKNNYNIV
jgi:nucleoside-diphosphate-sugar epimerase